MVIGLISRLTNQKGLDLVNDVIPGIMDEHTQVVVLGTGDSQYENTFRYYENKYKGNFCAYIAYNEMWLTIFMQDVMHFWFHQDLNHVDLHSL